MSKKLTTEEFIAKARAVYGDKYDYSKTIYATAREKVSIYCRIHGLFSQIPNGHLAGNGCAICNGKAKITNSLFIEKARAIHGEKLDYSQVCYVGDNLKILIICPEHGGFRQNIYSHFNGAGCPSCAGNARRTVAEFVNDANNRHGNKYDYSEVHKASVTSKVTIKCPVHGKFQKRVGEHLKGAGCPICTKERVSATLLSTTTAFVEKAKQIHGEKYDYSATSYSASSQKVIIICPVHGNYQQTPNKHLSGQGCLFCNKKNGWSRTDWVSIQKKREAILYVLELNSEAEKFYKVGISYNLEKRYKRHPLPYNWRTLALYKSHDAAKIYDLENQLHREFAALRYSPACAFPGQTECYISALEILAALPPETFFCSAE